MKPNKSDNKKIVEEKDCRVQKNIILIKMKMKPMREKSIKAKIVKVKNVFPI